MPIRNILQEGCESRCRGCAHRELGPEESELRKQNWVEQQLRDWSDAIQPIRGIRGVGRWHYRQKLCLHAEWKQGEWHFGLQIPKPGEQRGGYEILDIRRCPIHAPWVEGLLKELSFQLPHSQSFPLVFVSIAGRLVTLVLKTKDLPQIPSLNWEELGVEGLWVNLNPVAGNRVYSSRGWKLIWGKERVFEQGLWYGPESFQQLIPQLHESALREVKDFLNPSLSDGVIDLYSGIGRSLQIWTEAQVPCIGVELNGDAVTCSKLNIKEDKCLRGRVSDRIPQLQVWIEIVQPHKLLVYANPPRLGLERDVIQWLGYHARPERIAYLSCSPGTLARDLFLLAQANYDVQRIIPYDFFPQTHHVESLALLVRK